MKATEAMKQLEHVTLSIYEDWYGTEEQLTLLQDFQKAISLAGEVWGISEKEVQESIERTQIDPETAMDSLTRESVEELTQRLEEATKQLKGEEIDTIDRARAYITDYYVF